MEKEKRGSGRLRKQYFWFAVVMFWTGVSLSARDGKRAAVPSNVVDGGKVKRIEYDFESGDAQGWKGYVGSGKSKEVPLVVTSCSNGATYGGSKHALMLVDKNGAKGDMYLRLRFPKYTLSENTTVAFAYYYEGEQIRRFKVRINARGGPKYRSLPIHTGTWNTVRLKIAEFSRKGKRARSGETMSMIDILLMGKGKCGKWHQNSQ